MYSINVGAFAYLCNLYLYSLYDFLKQCGRPYYLGKCKCGADIGGQGHILHAGNRQDMGSEFFWCFVCRIQ